MLSEVADKFNFVWKADWIGFFAELDLPFLSYALYSGSIEISAPIRYTKMLYYSQSISMMDPIEPQMIKVSLKQTK
jgi:hypothetical protein